MTDMTPDSKAAVLIEALDLACHVEGDGLGIAEEGLEVLGRVDRRSEHREEGEARHWMEELAIGGARHWKG